MKKLILIFLLLLSQSYAQSELLLLMGDEVDIWTINITSSTNPTITMQGTGLIKIDWGDGTSIEQYTLAGADQNISHTYSGSASRVIKIYNKKRITKFSTGSNVSWSFDLSSLPSGMTYFYCLGNNTISDYTSGRTWANNME